MRGEDRRTGALFSYVDLEFRVRADHPLRAIREVGERRAGRDVIGLRSALLALGLTGGIAPERPSRALLAAMLLGSRGAGAPADGTAGVRPAVPLVRRARVDDPVWDASTFDKNRDRLLAGEVAQRSLAELLALPEVGRLLSSEHSSVDWPPPQAWASLKSFRRKDGEDEPPGPGPQRREGASRARSECREEEGHAARAPEHHHDPRLAHRWPHHPPQNRRTASLRVRKRIEEGFGWVKEVAGLAQAEDARPGPGRLCLRPLPRRLQPGAAAEAAGGGLAVSAPMGCRLIGRWRIVTADLWKWRPLDLGTGCHTGNPSGRVW